MSKPQRLGLGFLFQVGAAGHRKETNPGMGGREGAAGHRRETNPGMGGREGAAGNRRETNPGMGGREGAQNPEWLKNCKG